MTRSDARKRLHAVREPGSLIGLVGKKRSGKDTFASTLVAERGFTRFAFADPLKEAALALDPIIEREAWEDGGCGCCTIDYTEYERLSEIVDRLGWEKAKEIPEVRRTLQNYGVAIREIDPDFWIRATLDKALAHRGPVVVTDVRFPNEAEAITAAGGIIVRIVRPGLASDDTHVSETALDGYPADLDVLNAGTLETLAATARELTF